MGGDAEWSLNVPVTLGYACLLYLVMIRTTRITKRVRLAFKKFYIGLVNANYITR